MKAYEGKHPTLGAALPSPKWQSVGCPIRIGGTRLGLNVARFRHKIRSRKRTNLPIRPRALPPRHPFHQWAPGQAGSHCLRDPDPVHARRHDPPGVARPLPRREQPLGVHAVPVGASEMRIGEDVRVSTPVSTASCMAKPGISRANLPPRLADRRDREARQAGGQVGGVNSRLVRRHHLPQCQRRPGPPAGRRQAARERHNRCRPPGMPAAPTQLERDPGKRVGGVVGGCDADGRPAPDDAGLALNSAREYWLMPLVTTQPISLVAATTRPPGHMQKL